jgi:eukaryotic-like serine/threonine-protein kinase
MDERWQEIERIYHAAREMDKGARAEFLTTACGGDDDLRRVVERLLAQADRAGSFLETPAIEMAAEDLAKEQHLPDPQTPALEIGTMVAHYRLAGKIGEGGMGEVYRARDTKLQRDVALKILPQAMARDAERMARFEREAQVLASLNHPNIAAIHGLEESNGIRALVMELVEGETLAEKIVGEGPALSDLRSPMDSIGVQKSDPREPGGLPYRDILPIARQIAEALEYAHERGVIHRDLKPANVKITPEGTVKVLDFGLAKVLIPQDSTNALDPANSPTLSMTTTEKGMILGTAAYMSPEQARGQRVDRRCDIWAFGCVLFEMLSGRKAFEGETLSDVLAAVITKEPDWAALPETAPPSIQRLVRRCLVKDAKQRLRDIGEARITIEEMLSGSSLLPSPLPQGEGGPGERDRVRVPLLRRALPWALAAVGMLGCVILAFVAMHLLRQSETEQPMIQFPISPPQNTEFDNFVLSPDGRKLAFVASAPGTGAGAALWVRSLDSLAARPLQGTEWPGPPFWSPDGRYLGFFADGKLKKIAASGGPVQTLCDADGGGATWSRQGVIIFSNNGILYRVPDTGGEPTLVAAPDTAGLERGFGSPQFLPDGRHFLFRASGTRDEGPYIGLGSLGSKRTEALLSKVQNALYSPPGYLLFVQQGNLVARPFDAGRLQFTGQAVPIAEDVPALLPPWGAGFSISENGVLAYQARTGGRTDRMVWFNRKGNEIRAIGPQGIYTNPDLSHDGSKVAVCLGGMGKRDIWVYDLKRNTGSRLTFNPADDLNPVWSHDGSTIMFTSTRQGQRDLYEKSANGLGKTQLVYASKEQPKSLTDLSQDGRYALYDTDGLANTLWALPLFGDRKPFAVVEGNFVAERGRFSPDGRYIAYTSIETGQSEVYVQTFPQHLGKWEVSTSGGTEPMWRQDGKEMFYLKGDNTVMSVDVNTSSSEFRAGIPKPLFRPQIVLLELRNNYVVSPDGQGFLMLAPAGEAKPAPITVVLNWPALLTKQ